MLAFYPRFAFETLRGHFWMGYWLLRMAIVRSRINRDPERKSYFDLALQTGTEEEMDELTLFTTRGGQQAVVKRRSEDAARDLAKAGRAAE